MSNLSKKFLVPMSVAIAGLSAIPAQANISEAPNVQSSANQDAENNLKPSNRMIFSKGDELHSLLLVRNQQGIVLADHESHYSHSSHRSHSSHYSGN